MATMSPIAPVANPLHGFADARIGSPAKARGQAEVLLLSLFGGGHRDLDAGRVDAVRFLAEDVFAGIDGRFEHHGMEVRGGGDQHHIDSALDQLLVGVETDETMIVVDRHLIGLHFLQPLAAVLKAIGEDVGHRRQPNVLAGVHGVVGRPAAPSATADQADLDGVASGRVSAAGQRQRTIGRCARDG